jgi:transposase
MMLRRRRLAAPIVYDKFHIMQHANKAIDEVRRAEFFRG